MDLADIGRMSGFPKRKLLLCIGNDVVTIAPEVANHFLIGMQKMDQHTHACIGIPFGEVGLFETLR